jgi:hypothetical protein
MAMLRLEVLNSEGADLEVVESTRGEMTAGALLISEATHSGRSAAVDLRIGAFHLQYRFEQWPTGLVDFTALWIPQTQRLFLGGKRQSCVVNIATSTVEHCFEHCLFWSFAVSERPGFVLETGELDCLLRQDDGQIVARAPVDPPWEIHALPDGYRFESIVHGTTFLRYPGP